MISLKLDSAAINTLFASAEAKVELQQAVVAEICRRLFDKYVSSDVTNVINGLLASQKGALVEAIRNDATFTEKLEQKFDAEIGNIKKEWNSKTVTLKPEFREKIDIKIKEGMAAILKESGLQADKMIQEAIDGAVNRLTERAIPRIDAEVEKRVNKAVAEEIDRRTRAALDKALKSA